MKGCCEICGIWTYLDCRHVFEGQALRRISEKYGAKIAVCRSCHEAIHRHPLEHIYLKREAQTELMEKNGWSIDDWRRIFGRSYLK